MNDKHGIVMCNSNGTMINIFQGMVMNGFLGVNMSDCNSRVYCYYVSFIIHSDYE